MAAFVEKIDAKQSHGKREVRLAMHNFRRAKEAESHMKERKWRRWCKLKWLCINTRNGMAAYDHERRCIPTLASNAGQDNPIPECTALSGHAYQS